MAHQNVLHIILSMKRIVDMQRGPTRVTEYIFYAFLLKALDNNICAG
jgi:hypothetical protein